MKPQPDLQVNLSDQQRRFWVGVQYGLLVAMGYLMLSVPLKEWIREWGWWMLGVFVVVMVFSAGIHTMLALSIGNICQVKLSSLDERERASRDRAFIGAFQVLTLTVSIAWLYAAVASFTKSWLPEPSQLWMLLWLIGMMFYGLPTSIAAWQMKRLED